MKIMHLIRRGQLPLEEGYSYMCERPILSSSPCVVLTLHDIVIRCRISKGKTIAMVIGPHASKICTSGYLTPEMINVRWLHGRTSWLVVTTILIKPRNGKWVITPIVNKRFFFVFVTFTHRINTVWQLKR